MFVFNNKWSDILKIRQILKLTVAGIAESLVAKSRRPPVPASPSERFAREGGCHKFIPVAGTVQSRITIW